MTTNTDLWQAIESASFHILCAAEPDPASEARWNEVSQHIFGIPLLTHDTVALHQLEQLAARLEADGGDAEALAGVRALHHLVEQGQYQGAYWLARGAMHRVMELAVIADRPRRLVTGNPRAIKPLGGTVAVLDEDSDERQ